MRKYIFFARKLHLHCETCYCLCFYFFAFMNFSLSFILFWDCFWMKQEKKDELFLFPKSIVFLTGGKNNRIQNLKDFFLLSIIFSFFFSFRSLTFTVFAACVNLNSIIRLSVGNLIIKSAAVNLFCYGLEKKNPDDSAGWWRRFIENNQPSGWSLQHCGVQHR